MNGQLEVGRIYKRDTLDKSESQWLWAINGVPRAAPGVMRVAGIAASLEQAQNELQENWEKWLAWANLQESGSAAPLESASIPPASEEAWSMVPLQPVSEPEPASTAAEDIGGAVPLQPEPTPVTSELAQRELGVAEEARPSGTSPEPASVGQSTGAGRREGRKRRKPK
jgi:hypothetical protein